jgi:hypothetical protein
MNVLGHYDKENIHIATPSEIDDDNYFCKLSYNNMPFIIKTNKVCYYKKIRESKTNEQYVNISISSKEYLEWFEQFYHDCIELFHQCSTDWFENEMSLSDIEFSFINPLKSNIKNNCFDIVSSIDENRVHIIDTEDNFISLSKLTDCNVIPTFHIRGIKINTKHFMFEIELNNLCVILPKHLEENKEYNEPLEKNENSQNREKENTDKLEDKIEDKIENLAIQKEDDIDEFDIDTNNLDEIEIEINELNMYKMFELINKKIKENMVDNLKSIFASKKIKTNLELLEVINDDEEE